MQKIEHLVDSNSDLYDIELLTRELNIIKESINENNSIYEVLNLYNDNYLEKIDNFNIEFKFLNEYNYNLLNGIKSNKIHIENKDLVSLAVEAEKEVLKSIKETLQGMVKRREQELRTYELLIDFIQRQMKKEGVLG